MRNRVTYITVITLVIIMAVVSLAGCNKEPKFKLIATETTVETTTETVAPTESSETTAATTETTVETTVETTTEETTTETTVESNYKNNDVDFGNDKKAAETHKDNKGGKVTTTKSPSKKPSTTKKTTTKTATTKAPIKKPTTKPTTKPVVKPKTSKTPTKKPTPVPSKGYAMVKFKFSVTMRDKTEDGKYIVHNFTANIKCVTTKYHSKTTGDYETCDDDAASKAVKAKVGSNYRNYSGYKVKVVEFLN